MYMQNFPEESASSRGIKWFGKALAIGIILIVAAYGDVMYLQLMSSIFPNGGPLLVIAYLGAFTSFLSMVYMLIGKNVLFAPGKQMVLAWLVFLVELAMIALNILLIYQGPQNLSGFLGVWSVIAPTTPVLNMVGVALLYFLDEDQLERHEEKEFLSQQRRAQRHLQQALQRARLDVQYRQIAYMQERLADAVDDESSQRIIAQAANDMNTRLLSGLSGRGYVLPSPQDTSYPRPKISKNREKVAEDERTEKDSAPFLETEPQREHQE
jgi:hypothetical protein